MIENNREKVDFLSINKYINNYLKMSPTNKAIIKYLNTHISNSKGATPLEVAPLIIVLLLYRIRLEFVSRFCVGPVFAAPSALVSIGI